VVIGDGTKNFAKSLTTFRWAVDWCDRVGWKLFECCIYGRHGNPGAWWSQRFRVDHEYILIFFKGSRPRAFNKEPLMVQSKHAGKVYSGTDRLTNGGFKKIEPKEVKSKKCRGSIWWYATSNTEGNRVKLKHPATYPDQLAADLVDCFSVPGDLVLDPMCGSGTTCVVSANLGRRYLGMEISQEYAQIARQRITNETGGLVNGGFRGQLTP
jgi:site-specific DNA-methyltransferase (adenine-specific)